MSKKKRKRHKLGKGAWIVDSSGVAPEGERMKRYADASSKWVDELFRTGKLKLKMENIDD